MNQPENSFRIEFCCRSEQRLKAELDELKKKLDLAVEALEKLQTRINPSGYPGGYAGSQASSIGIILETLRKIKAINLDV